MSTLIACMSSGKGTWGEVNSIIKNGNWDTIYLICSKFAYENFEISPSVALKLKFDEKNPQKSFEALSKFFKKSVKDFEVALNLTSGSGIEHMTILSSVLKSGLGVRFVYFHMNDIKEFEILDEKYIQD